MQFSVPAVSHDEWTQRGQHARHGSAGRCEVEANTASTQFGQRLLFAIDDRRRHYGGSAGDAAEWGHRVSRCCVVITIGGGCADNGAGGAKRFCSMNIQRPWNFARLAAPWWIGCIGYRSDACSSRNTGGTVSVASWIMSFVLAASAPTNGTCGSQLDAPRVCRPDRRMEPHFLTMTHCFVWCFPSDAFCAWPSSYFPEHPAVMHIARRYYIYVDRSGDDWGGQRS